MRPLHFAARTHAFRGAFYFAAFADRDVFYVVVFADNVRGSVARQRLEGGQNRPVAGTSANVAAERIFYFLHGEAAGFVHGVHVHQHAGGAEAALGAAELHEGFLDGVVARFYVAD